MTYKTILVHVDASSAAEQRFRFGAGLARSFDAHLTGCAPTGISRFIPPDVVVRESTPLADFCATMRANATDSLQRFAQIVSEEDVRRVEQRMIDDDASGIALHARYADLVVLSQPDDAMPTRGSASDLPGYLLRESGRPLLVVPRISCRPGTPDKVLLAWDGSMEATRAIVGALPLLRVAGSVSIVSMHRGRTRPDDGALCSAMEHYLQRQGVSIQTHYCLEGNDAGTALLSVANDEKGDLLVMGGYGRSPLRESVLGGVTATVLHSMTLPVLLAH
ncbi:MAG: universal stress protein [Janthinobacterium lividum]